MKPAARRLTRHESRAQTRQRLLEAAARVIAHEGFGGASVEEIAATAGFTRGAFYSNFKSKDELLLELLRREKDAMQEELARVFAGSGGSAAEPAIEQRLLDFYGQLYRDNDCFLYWTEAKLLAARDKRFRGALNALLREDRARIAALVTAYRERTGTSSDTAPRDVAIACMAMVDGMRFLHLIDAAEIGDAVADRVLRDFFSRMALARGSAT